MDPTDKQIMVEYHRYLLLHNIATYVGNNNFINLLELMLVNGVIKAQAENRKIKKDILELDYDFSSIEKQLHNDGEHSKDIIRKIIDRIKRDFRNFVSQKEFPNVSYGYDQSSRVFHCGDYYFALPEERHAAMEYKLTRNGHVNPWKMILFTLLRFHSIIGRFAQWSIPMEIAERIYQGQYYYEVYQNPINSQNLLLDYRNKTNHSRCYSIFSDIDAFYGNSQKIAELKKTKHVVYLPTGFQLSHKNKISRDAIIISQINLKLNDKITTTLPYYEYHNLTDRVIYIQPNYSLHFYNFPYSTIVKPLVTSDEEFVKEMEKKLRIEWNRYLIFREIKMLTPTKNDFQFREWNNIVERFLLAMANEPMKENDDYIMKEMPLNHDIYKLFNEEMAMKKIENISQVANIKRLIKNFLNNKTKEQLPEHYGFDGTHYYCGNFKRKININRHMRMIMKLANIKMEKYYQVLILITMLRYQCLNIGGQQWNFPFAWHEFLYENYGVNNECFASPFNSQLLMIENKWKNKINFGSLFYDTDHYFGSFGNLFELDIATIAKNNEVSVSINPPYVLTIMNNTMDLMDKWFASKYIVNIFFGVPPWRDTDYYQRLKNHKHLIKCIELNKDQFYYENSNEINNPVIHMGGIHNSVVVAVLSNNPKYQKIDFDKVLRQFGNVKYLQ